MCFCGVSPFGHVIETIDRLSLCCTLVQLYFVLYEWDRIVSFQEKSLFTWKRPGQVAQTRKK